MIESAAITEHYDVPSLTTRITEALRKAGLGDGRLDWEDLTPLDQFHVRGLAATRELAAELHIAPDATILDVGSGVGGASRFLAATYGSHVTGIDLNPSFVEAASMLSDRAGLAGRTAFRVADAVALPFADSSFDYVWTQHVAMNIHDRARLYSEFFRVLKPGGSLAVHDVVQGDAGPLLFPVPWARVPETSFLLTSDAMREVLTRCGFEVVSWIDTTDAMLAWMEQIRAATATQELPPLGLHVVTGPDFRTMLANLGRNVREGRARLIQAILTRAA